MNEVNKNLETTVNKSEGFIEKEMKLSTEHIAKNPRIGEVDLSELRFFSYEKQKSHN